MPRSYEGAPVSAPSRESFAGRSRDFHSQIDWPAQLIARRYGLAAAMAAVIAGHLFVEARP